MAASRRPLPLVVLLLSWLLTRAAMVAVVYWSAYPSPGAITGDTRLYVAWASVLRHGHFPATDPNWQYPPGAAGLLLAPTLLDLAYYPAFVVAMLAVDLAVLLGLVGRGDGDSVGAAGWLWVVGIAAVGPVALNRFDLVPTGLAVAGLLMRSPYAAGGLLGLGGLVKLWPAVLVGSVRAGSRRVAALAAAGVIAVPLVALAATGQLGAALSFLGHGRDRGLQIESVVATPYLLVHALAPGGGGYSVSYRYGAYEILGGLVGLGVAVTTLASLAVLAAYAVLARRDRVDRAGLALAVVLMLTVTSKVLSPQYLVWAVGVGAAALLREGRRYLPPLVLLVAAAALTQVVFPGTYLSLLHARPAAVALLALRNVLLLTASVLAVRRAVTNRRDAGTPDAISVWLAHTFRGHGSLEGRERST